MFPSWSTISHSAIDRKLTVSHLVPHVQNLIKFILVHNTLLNLTEHPLYCSPVNCTTPALVLYLPCFQQCPSYVLPWAPGGDTVLSRCATLRCPVEWRPVQQWVYQMQHGSGPELKQKVIMFKLVHHSQCQFILCFNLIQLKRCSAIVIV